ncbi:hypothetical protein KIPB_012095, partial [Kipferlia bialata]|eukprot:g12095.t1
MRISTIDRSIETLCLDNSGIDNEALLELIPTLATFSNLKRLYLRQNAISRVPEFEFLPNLEVLDLSENPVVEDVEAAISALERCVTLQHLVLCLPDVESEDDVIVSLPSLVSLNGMALTEELSCQPPSPPSISEPVTLFETEEEREDEPLTMEAVSESPAPEALDLNALNRLDAPTSAHAALAQAQEEAESPIPVPAVEYSTMDQCEREANNIRSSLERFAALHSKFHILPDIPRHD